MAEAYLRSSLNFNDPEVSAFFSEMADAESSHARALDSLIKRPEMEGIWIEMPEGLHDELTALINSKVKQLKEERDLDRALLLLADLEQSELNNVFDSIVKGLADHNLAHLELITKQHIRFIQERTAKFNIGPDINRRINELLVKDRYYYRLFTD